MEFTPEGFKKYLAELKLARKDKSVAQDLFDKRLFSQIFKESLQQMAYKYMWFETGKNRKKFNEAKIKQDLHID